MSVSEQQIPLRAANDNEHAEIEKQLLSWAKTLVFTMVFILILTGIACIFIFIELLKSGVPAIVVYFLDRNGNPGKKAYSMIVM